MCCKTPSPTRSWILGLGSRVCLAALPLLLTASGCGRQGDPLPPPSRIPAHVQDLAVEQRGEEVRLEFPYPTVTEGGLPLEGVSRVEVWEAVQPWQPPPPPTAEEEAVPGIEPGDVPAEEVPVDEVPLEEEAPSEEEADEEPAEGALEEATEDFAAPQPTAAPALPRMTPYELEAAAREIATFEGESLQQAIVGGRVILSLARQQLGSPTARELEEAAEEDEAEEAEATEEPAAAERELLEAHFIAVKTTSPEGKTSTLSNPALLFPADPPPPPTELATTPQEEGVELTWRLPPGVELEGSVVYRRGEREQRFGAPLATLPAGVERLVDGDIEYDRTYVYAVASVARRRPRVQSAMSAETSVRVEDVFAPAAPLRVAAFPAPDRVRLIWEASTSNDVAGYRVERRVAEGAFEPLTPQPLTTTEYVDTDVRPGDTYTYRVLVLDDAGNVSEPSAEEVVRIP